MTLRIFDRVASGESVFAEPGHVGDSQLQASWRKMSHTSTRLVADEAAQYAAQSDRNWHVADGDFGVMRPSFESMWIEWQTPRFLVSDGIWHSRHKQYMACVIQQKDDDTLSLSLLVTYDGAGLCCFPLYIEIVNFADFSSIDAMGELVYDSAKLYEHMATRDDVMAGLNSQIVPAYLTLGWLNCRNVTTENVRPDTRIADKRERRGQPRGLDYKRIVLDEGTRRALTVNRDAERNGKRLHIVRGHIKHYSLERPLFGKLTGNYWWHQQMRGDAGLGRINHEYHVQSRGTR